MLNYKHSICYYWYNLILLLWSTHVENCDNVNL